MIWAQEQDGVTRDRQKQGMHWIQTMCMHHWYFAGHGVAHVNKLSPAGSFIVACLAIMCSALSSKQLHSNNIINRNGSVCACRGGGRGGERKGWGYELCD